MRRMWPARADAAASHLRWLSMLQNQRHAPPTDLPDPAGPDPTPPRCRPPAAATGDGCGLDRYPHMHNARLRTRQSNHYRLMWRRRKGQCCDCEAVSAAAVASCASAEHAYMPACAPGSAQAAIQPATPAIRIVCITTSVGMVLQRRLVSALWTAVVGMRLQSGSWGWEGLPGWLKLACAEDCKFIQKRRCCGDEMKTTGQRKH